MEVIFICQAGCFDYIMPPMNAVSMVSISHIQIAEIKMDNKRVTLYISRSYYQA